MATYDIAVIRAALKALLQTLTTVASAKVYDYRNSNIEGYPSVIFDLTDEEGAMLDDANNVRTLTFTIWAIVELPVNGEVAAKVSLDAVTKEVVNLLEKKSNADLTGTVDWTMPAIGKRAEAQTPEGNVIYQEILLKCNVASSIL